MKIILNKVIYPIAFGLLFSLGCSKKAIETCGLVNFSPVNWQYLQNYTIVDSKWEDKFLVINSKQELDAQLIRNPQSSYIGFKDVDFNTSTLLVGKKAISQGAGELISQQVDRVCETDKYIYKVSVKNGGYTALTNFYFGVVVPKTGADAVKFEVSVTP